MFIFIIVYVSNCNNGKVIYFWFVKIAYSIKMNRLLSFLGKKGTVEVLENLSSESIFYSDIESNIHSISEKTLTERLQEMEEIGIVAREVHDNRRVSYKLTTFGEKVVDLVDEIAEFEKEEMG